MQAPGCPGEGLDRLPRNAAWHEISQVVRIQVARSAGPVVITCFRRKLGERIPRAAQPGGPALVVAKLVEQPVRHTVLFLGRQHGEFRNCLVQGTGHAISIAENDERPNSALHPTPAGAIMSASAGERGRSEKGGASMIGFRWRLALAGLVIAAGCRGGFEAEFNQPPFESYTVASCQVSFDDARRSVPCATVAVEFFRAAGVRPYVGRFFSAADYGSGAQLVIVLSHATWAERFGKSPTIIGRAVVVDGRPGTVVGVAAPEFRFPGETQLWLTRRDGGQ